MKPAQFIHIPAGIDGLLLKKIFDEHFEIDQAFAGIGDVHSKHLDGILTFLSDGALVEVVNSNPHISGSFCLAADADALRGDIAKLIVDDPKYYFFTLMDHLAKNFHEPFATQTGDDCEIAPTAHVSPTSVVIGSNVTIEAGAYIAAGTHIDDDVIVRANASVGVDGFQHQRTSRGVVSPLHDGLLFVASGVEIGYSSSISRGFSYRPTRICSDVKIDAFAYVGHGSMIGAETIVCTHACVMGHVTVGQGSWLGPGSLIVSRAVIGEGATVSIGSVLTTDIPAGAHYTGNFAIPHNRFISDLKSKVRN